MMIFIKEWFLKSVFRILLPQSLLLVVLYLVFLTLFFLYEQASISRTARVIWIWLAILSSIVWILAQSILLGKNDLI